MTTMRERSVLVTGSSSGIGRASALLLAERGIRVFAGVRRPEDGAALRAAAGPGLTPVLLDVADPGSIAAAATQVAAAIGASGLDGLANVAGIGIAGPLEHVRPDELRRIFEVNVFGQVAVIQAFLPLIRQARGRIVNVSSVGAHVAIPFGGALCASKGAFGLLSDALRLELRPFGIRVATIEPASIRTPAADKTLGDVEAVVAGLPPEGAARYGDMLRRFTARAYAQEQGGSPPEVVARAILHALTAARPRARYAVGRHATPLTLLPKLLPDRLLDALRLRVLGLPTRFGGR